MVLKLTAREKIIKSRIQLLMNMSFFGHIIMNLKLQESKEILTMATDARYIYFNEEFVDSLNEKQLMFVLLHELLHVIFRHCDPRFYKNKIRFILNMAMDYTVNNYMTINVLSVPKYKSLLEFPKMTNKKGESVEAGLVNMDYKDLNTLEIYELLIKQFQQDNDKSESFLKSLEKDLADGKFDKITSSMFDEHMYKEDLTEEDKEYLDNLKDTIENLAQQAQLKGNLPSGMERIITIKRRTRDWKTLLKEYVTPMIGDFSFLHPDRRYSFGSILLPGIVNDEDSLQNVCVLIDTSGSISSDLLNNFIGEIAYLSMVYKEFDFSVYFYDAKLYEEHKITSMQDISKVKPKGGGGTSVINALDSLKELKKEKPPIVTIILTDGEDDLDIKDTVGTDYIWLIRNTNTTIKPSIGRTIFIED